VEILRGSVPVNTPLRMRLPGSRVRPVTTPRVFRKFNCGENARKEALILAHIN
jgi:hypothetical protein